jgi:hypothetical protein
MFDPLSIGAALTSIKAILDLLKNANDAQLAMKITSEIGSLQGRLIEVQQQVLAAQAESDELRAENQRLKTSVFHHGVTWRKLPDGTEDGPFCPTCVGEGRDNMRLILAPHVDQSGALLHFLCPTNNDRYQLPKELVPNDRYFCP